MSNERVRVNVFQIYVITNNFNGKLYVGQTTRNVEKRRREHLYGLTNSVLTLAAKKHGKKNFSLQIISWCSSQEELNAAEIFCIKYFGSHVSKFGYNVDWGARGAGKKSIATREKLRAINLGKHLSEATKAKISKSHFGKPKPKPEGFGEKVRQILTGKRLTPEVRAKISAAQKGKPKGPYGAEHRKHLSEAFKGRPGTFLGKRHTEGAKAKQRAAKLGKRHTEEAKAKIGAFNRGKRDSEETKAKKSASALAYLVRRNKISAGVSA